MSYIDVSLSVLKRFNNPLPFDVYVKRTDIDYTKIFKETDLVDWSRLDSYESKGVNYLYVTDDQFEKYSIYVLKLGSQIASGKTEFKDTEVIEILKEMINLSMNEIRINQKMNFCVLENSLNVVKSTVDNLGKDPKILFKVISLLSGKPYLYKHCFSVSILSVLLAKAANIKSSNSLNIIGMGAFLHDIGISQLTFDPEDKENLTPKERKEMCMHPEMGKRMLDSFRSIKTEVLEIVMQHHEQPNGHGYPNSMREGEIYPLAKIVSVADAFSSLVSNRSFRRGFETSEALKIMKNEVGKFDREYLDIFTKLILPKS